MAKKILIAVTIFLLQIPSIFANSYTNSITSQFNSIFQNSDFRFFMAFMLLFICFYGIIAASLTRVNIFADKKKSTGINKTGKVTAVSLALLSTLGILMYVNYSAVEFTSQVFKTFGWFGAIILSMFIVGLYWFNVGKDNSSKLGAALMMAGLGLFAYGILLDDSEMILLGFLFLILGIITYLISSISAGSDGSSGNSGSPQQQPPPRRNRPNPRQPGNDDENDDDDNDEDDDDKNEEIPDYSSILQQITQLLNQYNQNYITFKASCNDVLQTHHDHLRSIGGYTTPTNPVSSAQLQRVQDGLNILNTITQKIIRLFDQITSDSNFSNITTAQHTQYTQLQNQFITYINTFQSFQSDYTTRYANGDPPA